MNDAALLFSAKPATKPIVQPARDPQQNQGQPGDAAAAALQFFSLLVEVEEIAATGDQVLATGAEARPAPNRSSALQQQLSLNAQLQSQASAAETSLIDAAPALAAGKPVRTLSGEAPRPGSLSSSQLRLENGLDLRREVVELRPGIQQGVVRPQNPFTNPLQNTGLMAEELQLAEQLKPQSGQQAPKLETQIASAPRLEAVLAQQAAPETSNPVVRQVATNLQFVARGEMERVRFDLYPEELGRVQIQMQKSGSVTRLTIVAETPQAYEALARGANGLQASLQQSGFDADEMTFEHREGRSEEREAADERRERRDDARRDDDQPERREVIVRPALTRADSALFL